MPTEINSCLTKHKRDGKYWGYYLSPSLSSAGTDGIIGVILTGTDREDLKERKVWYTGKDSARKKLNAIKEEKIGLGYKVIEESSLPITTTPDSDSDNPVLLPKPNLPSNWREVSKLLTLSENKIYEEHKDSRTKHSVKSLCTKFEKLMQNTEELDPDVLSVRKAVFLLLRITYLYSLLSVQIYKPDIQEAGRLTLKSLIEESSKLPEKHKNYLFEKISTGSKENFSIKGAVKQIDDFAIQMIQEIENKKRIGVGGVNRARALKIRKRLENEKKKRIS